MSGDDAVRRLICEAIDRRRCIRFRYDGHERVVEPHVHGETRAGKKLVRGYQVAGGSASGNEPPWRLFDVDKMSALRIGERKFVARRPDYNPDDPAIEVIYRQL